MEDHQDLAGGIERDREINRRFQELFNDPGRAAEVLGKAAVTRDIPGSISSVLLDNATIEHARRYFSDARWDSPRARLPVRPRLMLLAVADFVNAAILYENVLTGPENMGWGYGDPLMQQMQQIWTGRYLIHELSWTEIFAVLALAKATAAEAVREQGIVDVVGGLLKTSLSVERVLSRLDAISTTTAGVSPHNLVDDGLYWDEDCYRHDLSMAVLGDSQTAVTVIDQADGEGYWDTHESNSNRYLSIRRLSVHPELFAAHLIYRTHVYLYLADLLGCPYSADALRRNLIRPQPRRGFAERVATLVGEAQSARDQQVNELLGFEAFKVRIPLVLKYVLSRASKPSEVLEITLETRESRPARRFREYCARVDAAIAGGKRDDVTQACAELSSYGVRLEAELAEQGPTQEQAVQAARELVSVGSPLFGALIPGLALAAGQASHRLRRRRFAFVEQLIRTPRNLNEVEGEFARLWPYL